MSEEKKRQHYVPRFYLKFFSDNGQNSQIGVYNLKHKFFKRNVSIASQAQENYFYGKDGVLEDQLSKIESTAAPLLKEILNTNKFPPKVSKDYLIILSFSILLGFRTKSIAIEMNELINDAFKLYIQYDYEAREKLKDYTVTHETPAEIGLAMAAKMLPLTFDLKAKLILNRTNQKFITSDHPVVRYNQYLEQRKHPGGNTGIANKGLQIFFPISPNHLIVFYDEWVYKIGSRKTDLVELNSVSDVDQLNLLQIINCNEQVYCDRDVPDIYLQKLVSRGTELKLKKKSSDKLVDSYKDDQGQDHFFHVFTDESIEMNLTLLCIAQTKKAKKHILSDYAVQLRNESLIDYI